MASLAGLDYLGGVKSEATAAWPANVDADALPQWAVPTAAGAEDPDGPTVYYSDHCGHCLAMLEALGRDHAAPSPRYAPPDHATRIMFVNVSGPGKVRRDAPIQQVPQAYDGGHPVACWQDLMENNMISEVERRNERTRAAEAAMRVAAPKAMADVIRTEPHLDIYDDEAHAKVRDAKRCLLRKAHDVCEIFFRLVVESTSKKGVLLPSKHFTLHYGPVHDHDLCVVTYTNPHALMMTFCSRHFAAHLNHAATNDEVDQRERLLNAADPFFKTWEWDTGTHLYHPRINSRAFNLWLAAVLAHEVRQGSDFGGHFALRFNIDDRPYVVPFEKATESLEAARKMLDAFKSQERN